MADTHLPAGSTIDVTFSISQAVTNFDNVLLSAYTNPKNTTRYAYVAKTGFGAISLNGDTTHLKVKILGKYTAKMQGRLYLEIKLVKDTNDTDTERNGQNVPIDTTIIIDNVDLKNFD